MLRRNTRGAAIQVGAAVLLGFVVIALAMYQAQVVPSQNEEVEFNHNERVQKDMQKVHADATSVASGSDGGTTAVSLGTTYPARSIFINPDPASGTLRTETAGTWRIENATAVSNDGPSKYWNQTVWKRTSDRLRYQPGYHYYQNAPTTTLEHGMLYNVPPRGDILNVGEEIFIDDDELRILSLQGGERSVGLSETNSRSITRVTDDTGWNSGTYDGTTTRSNSLQLGYDPLPSDTDPTTPSFGLTGYWPLNGDNGTNSDGDTVNDISSNGADGTTRGSVDTTATGLFGNESFAFDGTEDYVEASPSDVTSTSFWADDNDSSWTHYAVSNGTQYVDGRRQTFDNTYYRTDDGSVEFGRYTTGGVDSGHFKVSSTGAQSIDVGFEPDVISFRITSTNNNFDTKQKRGGEPFGWGHGYATCSGGTCENVALTTGAGSASTNGMAAASSDQYSIFQVLTPSDGNGITGWINASVTDTDEDGFTIDVSRADESQQVTYTAYRFGDNGQVDIGSFQTLKQTKNQTLETGFEPDLLQTKIQPNDAIDSMGVHTQEQEGDIGWGHGVATKRNGNIEQFSMAVSAQQLNIDYHSWAASDEHVLDMLEMNPKTEKITNRTTASLAEFQSDGFKLNYTNASEGQVALYMAIKTDANTTVGTTTTPMNTGTQEVSAGIEADHLSFIASNTINNLSASGSFVGPNVANGHYGWSFGQGTDDSQQSMGYSTHSNSVNGHASASSDSDVLRLPYSDQNGNILGTDRAAIRDITANNFTLDYSSVATTSTTNVRYDNVTLGYFGFDFSNVTEYYEGRIDEVTTYDRELSRSEVRALSERDLTGYWRFNEDLGTSSDGDTVTDSSDEATNATTNGSVNTTATGVTDSGSFSFDGTEDYVTATQSGELESAAFWADDDDGNWTHYAVSNGTEYVDGRQQPFENTYYRAEDGALEIGRHDPLSIDSGHFSVSKTGTKSVDVGFEPDVVAFRITSTNANFDTETEFESSDGGGSFGWGHGYATCSGGTCENVGLTNGAGSESTDGMAAASSDQYSIYQVLTLDDGSAIDGWIEANMTATSEDGFTVDVSRADESQQVTYTAYKFDDNDEVDIGAFSTRESLGNQNVTTGFEPTFLQTKIQPNDGIDQLGETVEVTDNEDGDLGWGHGVATKRNGTIEQFSMAVSAAQQDIDYHSWAASDDDVLDTLEMDPKDGTITDRVTASLDEFHSDKFELNYTAVGEGQLALYMAIKTDAKAAVGTTTTPATKADLGSHTVNTDIDPSHLSFMSSNTIDELDASGTVVQQNNADNHYGWAFGGGIVGNQQSMGYSTHSRSVNGHASASSDSDAIYLPYTDQDGNVIGRDRARLTDLSNGSFTLNWLETVESNSEIHYDDVVVGYYGFEPGPTPDYYQGRIDNFQAYDSELPADEIEDMALNTTGTQYNGSYTAATIEAQTPQIWEEMSVATNVPGNTDLSVTIETINNSVVQQTETRTLSAGQTEIDLQFLDETPKLRLSYNLSSTDAEITPSVDSFEVVYRNESFGSDVIPGDQYQMSTSGSASVRTRALSKATNTIEIEPDGDDPITVTIPTNQPEHWREQLATADHVKNPIKTVSGGIEVTLENGTYELQMAEVGFGDVRQPPANDRAQYLAVVDDTAPAVTVEVRDLFNNPVRNVDNVTVDGGTLASSSSDSDGELVIEGVSEGNVVNATLDRGEDNFSVEFTVESSPSGSTSAYQTSWKSTGGIYDVSVGDNTVDLTMETSPTADSARVDYATGDPALVQDGNTGWRTGSTNTTGEHTTSIPIDLTELKNRGGKSSLTIYASSGGSSDSLTVTVNRTGSGGSGLSAEMINGKQVITQTDGYGKWALVMNYEHLGGTNPESEIDRESTFPQLPNGLTTPSDINDDGANGELKHVDDLHQWGAWNVTAVRLFAETDNHDRTIHYFTEDDRAIDAIVTDDTKAGHDPLQSEITEYSDHDANLPQVAGQETDTASDRIFGYDFPMYGAAHHWGLAGRGNRWEVDDYPNNAGQTTVHRVWVRLGDMNTNNAITDRSTVVTTQKNNGKLQTVTDTSTGSPGPKAKATGPITDFSDGGAKRIPYVISTGSNQNKVGVIRKDGTGQKVLSSTDATGSKTALAAGTWETSTNHVYFVGSNQERIYRVDVNGNEEQVYTDGNDAYAVSGLADVTGDGSTELVYVDSNNKLRYLTGMSDTSSTKLGHTSSIGSNNGRGIGQPADFDGDGRARVPIVDGSNNIQLVNSDGVETQITSGAAKSPLASADWDSDGTPEIVFVSSSSGELKYVDDVAGTPTVKTANSGTKAAKSTGAT